MSMMVVLPMTARQKKKMMVATLWMTWGCQMTSSRLLLQFVQRVAGVVMMGYVTAAAVVAAVVVCVVIVTGIVVNEAGFNVVKYVTGVGVVMATAVSVVFTLATMVFLVLKKTTEHVTSATTAAVATTLMAVWLWL